MPSNITEIELNKLLKQYTPLVRNIAGKYYTHCSFVKSLEIEDIVQEGFIALYKAIKTWCVEKGAPFGYYAKLCIKRHIKNYVSRVTCSKRYTNSEVNYDNISIDLAITESKVGEIENKYELKHLLTPLKCSEREVLWDTYVNSLPLNIITNKYQLSQQRIQSVIKNALKKIKRFNKKHLTK